MKAEAVLDRLYSVLEGITAANGFRTDAGLYVYRRLQDMPRPDDMPNFAVFVRVDSLTGVGRYDDVDVTLNCAVSCQVQANQISDGYPMLDLAWDIRAALRGISAFTGVLTGLNSVNIGDVSFSEAPPGGSYSEIDQQLSITFREDYEVSL